jgi:protein-tyrosine phosphatase
MVDIHCHILPEVDDGAKSWDIALEMCRMAQEDGIEHVVASPHANDQYSYDRDQFAAKLHELSQRVGNGLNFSLGCDFHLSCDNLEDALANPERYTIGETGYLLVELSDYGIPPQIAEYVFSLRSIGLTPVLTHPERNPILQRNIRQVLHWIEQECVVQVTASSLIGGWGETARRSALWLLEHGAVHVLATDAHDHKHRVPVLSRARDLVAKQFGPAVAQALVLENPRAIVAGEPIPFYPKPMLKN